MYSFPQHNIIKYIYLLTHQYICFWSIQWITLGVIVGCDTILKLYTIENLYELSVSKLNCTGCAC